VLAQPVFNSIVFWLCFSPLIACLKTGRMKNTKNDIINQTQHHLLLSLARWWCCIVRVNCFHQSKIQRSAIKISGASAANQAEKQFTKKNFISRLTNTNNGIIIINSINGGA